MEPIRRGAPNSSAPNFRQRPVQPTYRQVITAPTNRPLQPVSVIQTQPQPTPAPPSPTPVTLPQTRTFEPPVELRKSSKSRVNLPRMKSRKTLFGALSLILIVGLATVVKGVIARPDTGVNPSGQKIVVSSPEVDGQILQTSCYTFKMPSTHKLMHTSGCGNDISLAKSTTESIISVTSTPAVSTFNLDKAPEALRQQLEVLGKVKSYSTSPIIVDGVQALKVVYAFKDGAERALIYAPNPPAQYVINDNVIGSFVMRGYYSNEEQIKNFDEVVSSFRWNK